MSDQMQDFNCLIICILCCKSCTMCCEEQNKENKFKSENNYKILEEKLPETEHIMKRNS